MFRGHLEGALTVTNDERPEQLGWLLEAVHHDMSESIHKRLTVSSTHFGHWVPEHPLEPLIDELILDCVEMIVIRPKDSDVVRVSKVRSLLAVCETLASFDLAPKKARSVGR